MPNYSSFPVLLDDCRTLSISKLKEWGYLRPNILVIGGVNWSQNGEHRASIGLLVNTVASQPYIQLDYKCSGEEINYEVYLVKVPSNLGKGSLWYFRCPRTGKRCRKLYLVDKYFLHRTAFKGCMYEKQTFSSRTRINFQQWERYFATEHVCEQIYSKYFKKEYAGKLTKRYQKLLKKIRAAELISEEDLIRYILK